ncbi:M1 family aminopeptidase [Rheinheimera sp. 4Y26]|uniref:M1 family aminopeptidase n=1 Tax=Rheinheimera sp. 4Y26 TaxID=2977811 RepID=UPI0021B0F3FA|nr:M1 family aminopeptidase [Rheinheimera sp. 4Y26]MCT6700395.1 M1 family aminopeptidase [Rheinheimera sp. 4Y26]
MLTPFAAVDSKRQKTSQNTLYQPQLLALLANEWRFYRAQPWFWLVLLLALAFAVLATIGNPPQSAQPDKELLISHTKLLMMLQPLLIGALAPLAFLRDQQAGMAELTGVTPVSQQQWCFSRAGALLLLALGFQLLLLILAATAVWGGIQPAQSHFSLGSLAGISILLFLLQQVPALLLLVALQLWCSRHIPQIALLYLLTACCFIAYMLLAAATGSPVMAQSGEIAPWLSQLMLYLDPYALTPWLVQLQNSGSITPGATLLLNRALIVALSLLLCWRALAAVPSAKGPKLTAEPAATLLNQQVASHSRGFFSRIQPDISALQSFISLCKLQGLQLLHQRSTILALLVLSGLVFSEVFNGLGYAEALSQLQPNSRDALNRINWDLLPRFGLVLLALWASQLSWLNRQLRCDGLIAATPVSGAMLLCSQLVVLWLMTLLLLLLGFAAVAVAELCQQLQIQPFEYLQQGFFTLLPLLVWAMLLLACHALLRSALQANLVVFALLLLALSPLPAMLELQHPLWRIGQSQLQMPDALLAYQASAGAGSFGGGWSLGGFWPYWLFWALVALVFWLLALTCYHRGTGHSRPLLRFGHPAFSVAAVVMLLALTQGLHLHQQLSQAGVLQHSTERAAERAAYERQYQHFLQQNQPLVSQVKLQLELLPSAQQARIDARLSLKNAGTSPISELLLTIPGGLREQRAIQQIRLAGAKVQAKPATGQTFDEKQPSALQLPHLLYHFDRPLAPGATAELQLQLLVQQQAISPAPDHQLLRPGFSYLRLLQLLPQPGFMPQLRLRDERLRADYGLAPLPASEIQPSLLAAQATPTSARYHWAMLDMTFKVPLGYQAIAAGTLKWQWQQDNSSYFHYQTSAPVHNMPAVLVVPWQPQQQLWQGIPLEIYSPYYNEATTLTMQAIQQTMQWFNSQIGPYPGDALRLVMMPDTGPTGYALPQLVLINHRVGLRAQAAADAGFSQIYRRTVHEVAHQWFGHGVGNGVPGDGAFLVESLAKYAELVLIEQHFGQQAMQALVDYEQQRYQNALAGSVAEAKSLVDADESYDQYSRATLVFARLRAELGDPLICQALRQLWQQHRYPAKPASAMDFVRQLQALSPADKQPLIRQLLLEAKSPLATVKGG